MRFRYTNAGHNPPLLVRAGGEVELLDTGGPALARLFGDQPFSDGEVDLRAGDRVIIFTDGLTEASDESGEPFGDDRLLDEAISRRQLPAGELQEALLATALRHSGGTLQDDLTLLVIEVAHAPK